ncbi:MAG: hypothetical protein IKB02_09935 [Clostridia bacterium]|nr:hypothetical protein [Clostridia bacterium]MBR2389053.1 hypothetical protein [Clostridia bacterium]
MPTLAELYRTNTTAKGTTMSSLSSPVEEKKDFGEGLAYLGEKVAVGFVSSIEGIWDYTASGIAKLFGADEWAEEQIANDWFGDWYSHPDEWFQPTGGWKIAGDVASGIGTSLPAMAAAIGITIASGGAAAPAAVGLVSATIAGLGAAGRGVKEAYEQTGQLGGKEYLYGTGVGLVEGGIEGVTNALGLGGVGSVIKNFGKSATKSMASRVGVAVVDGFLGEAFEEGLSEFVTPYIKKFTYDPNAKNATAQEILYASLVGGLSGAIMSGGGATVDVSSSLISGTKAVNEGRTAEIINSAEIVSAFEESQKTGMEFYERVSSSYKALSESIAKTGGEVKTANQRMMLGDLSRADVTSKVATLLCKEASNILNDAEGFVARFNGNGYTDLDGNTITITAEGLTKGFDRSNPNSIAEAIKTNDTLRTLSAMALAGKAMSSTSAMADSVLRGNILSKTDLAYLKEKGSIEEIEALSKALNIEDWTALTKEGLADKLVEYKNNGGLDEYVRNSKLVDKIKKTKGKRSVKQGVIGLKSGNATRFNEGNLGIARDGDNYILYNFDTNIRSRLMTKEEVNEYLRNYSQETYQAEQTKREEANAKRKAEVEELDTWARENIKDYAGLVPSAKLMVREVIRQARANGLSETDVKMWADMSAHSGLDVAFDKSLSKTKVKVKQKDGSVKEETKFVNAYYDEKNNRIVANPEARISQEKALFHELDHALRAFYKKKGINISLKYKKALDKIDEDTEAQIEKEYGADQAIIDDETTAFYAAEIMATKGYAKALATEQPSVIKRILSFFKEASNYKNERLSRAAKSYYKLYQKMYAEFSAANRGNNALGGVEGSKRYSLIGRTKDGRGIYRSNYPENTPKDVKQKDIVDLVQNVWSEKPIKLKLIVDGKTIPIEAKFNPELTERSDLSKIAFGNRKGTASEKRITMNLSSDLYQIAEESHHVRSKIETGKDNAAHAGVTTWHYFLTNLVYVEANGTEIECYMNIDVKQNDSGHWFYSFAIEKGSCPADVLSVVTDKSATTSTNSISQTPEKSTPSTKKDGETKLPNGARASVDIDSFDISQYNDIELLEDEYAQIQSEGLTWGAGRRNKILTKTFIKDGYDVTIAYWISDSGIVHPISRKETQYINERNKEYDIKDRKQPDRAVEEFRLGQRNNSGSIDTLRNRRKSGETNRSNNREIRPKERSDRARYTENGSDVDGSKKTRNQLINSTDEDYFKALGRNEKLKAQSMVDDASIASMGNPDGQETAIIIKDAHKKDGRVVDFANAILDGKKKGEVRKTKTLTRKWVGIAKDGKVIGRVRFGEPIVLRKGTQEYHDSLIEGTEYDIADGETKYYYPVEEIMDLRDNPRKYYHNNGIYGFYDFKETDVITRDDNGNIIPLSERFNSENPDIRYSLDIDGTKNDSNDNKAVVSKNRLAQLRANYQGEKVFYKKDILVALSEVDGISKLTKKKIGIIADRLCQGYNQRVDEQGYEKYTLVMKDKLFDELNESSMTDEEVKSLKEQLEKALKRIVSEGRPSEKTRLLQQAARESNVKYWKDEYKKLVGRNELINTLIEKAKKMRDIKLGVFSNITQLDSDKFKGSIEKLARIDFRGNLNKSGTRKIIAELRSWYTTDNTIMQYINETSPGYYNKSIAEMLDTLSMEEKDFTNQDLKMLIDVMSYFTHFVENYNKVWRNGKWLDAMSECERYIKLIEANKGINIGLFGRKFGGKLGHWYSTLFGDPMSIARRMDMYESGFFTEMIEDIRLAAEEAAVAEVEVKRDYDAFLKKNKKYLKNATEEMVTYRGVKIDKLHLIGLYMTMKRKHAHAGLAYNGFKFIHKGEKYDVSGFVDLEANLNEAQLEAEVKKQMEIIEKELSDLDKEYISILEKGYNVDLRKLKVDRDMQRLGFTNATDGYYYPIIRADKAINIDVNDVKGEIDRVTNSSFNKDTVKGAKQQLFIEDADVCYNRHAHAVCQYSYFHPVVDAFNHLFNMDISGNPNKPVSVRTASENVWEDGMDYFHKLISDVQGIPAIASEGAKFFAFLRTGYARYQLGANPKVLATQFSSLFASSSILDYDSIVRGMTLSSADVEEYCSLAMLRNYDNAAAKAQGNLDSKVGDLFVKPIGTVDKLVIGRLFGACQVQVEKNGGPKIGTKENKVKAGELLRKVILETQQNSFATERSQAMRSGSEFWRAVTMFTSDSMKVFGRVVDSTGEAAVLKAKLKAATTESERADLKSKLKDANKKVRKSITALTMTAVFMASISQAFRWLYDKDQKEDESVIETMFADTFGNLFGGLPLLKDAYSFMVNGYEMENYTYSAINDLLSSIKGLMEIGDSNQTLAAKVRKVSYALGQVYGIPVRNIFNVLYGLTKRFSPTKAYKIDNTFYKKNFQNDLYKAMEDGDGEMVGMLMGMLYNERMSDTMSESVHNELYDLFMKGYKVMPKAVASKITYNGEEIELSAEQQNSLRQSYSSSQASLNKLFSNAKYKTLSEEDKVQAIKYVYELHYDSAFEDILGIDGGKSVLLNNVFGADILALYYILTKGLESDKDKDGKTISGTKKKKMLAAIKSLGLSSEEQMLLLCAKGYSINDSDVGNLSSQLAKKRLLRYILNLKNISKENKAKLAEMCNFQVKNGKIIQKSVA